MTWGSVWVPGFHDQGTSEAAVMWRCLHVNSHGLVDGARPHPPSAPGRAGITFVLQGERSMHWALSACKIHETYYYKIRLRESALTASGEEARAV